MFTPPGLSSEGMCFSTEQTSSMLVMLGHFPLPWAWVFPNTRKKTSQEEVSTKQGINGHNIKQPLYHEQHQELVISSISLVFPSNPGPKILELSTFTTLLDQKEELSLKDLTPQELEGYPMTPGYPLLWLLSGSIIPGEVGKTWMWHKTRLWNQVGI